MAQDPLKPGLRDELVTEELSGLLAHLGHEQLIADPLRTSDAVERLGKHLLLVARRMRTPSDSEALKAETALVNAAIEARPMRGVNCSPILASS